MSQFNKSIDAYDIEIRFFKDNIKNYIKKDHVKAVNASALL